MRLRGAGDNSELLFDPEIERTARQNRKAAQQARRRRTRIMAIEANSRERTMAEYVVVSPEACATSIVRLAVTANNFEIKPAYISLVQQEQFSGAPAEDPAEHVAHFLSILDFFKIQGASDDAIRLRLFPFCLRDRAKSWLLLQPQGSLTTWEGLSRNFIDKYFPPAKQARLRQDINGFVQQE